MDDFEARWRKLDPGDQSYVRRASRRGRRVEPDFASVVVEYSRRRLERWWNDVFEIAPAIVLLLVLPYLTDRETALTANGNPAARVVVLIAVGVAFVLLRRWRYGRAVRLNAGPGEPAGSH